jgi:pteridine reductase
MSKLEIAPVAFLTGASRRIGKQTAIELHQAGYNIAIHYHQSSQAAEELCETLNSIRDNSCVSFHADITRVESLQPLIDSVTQKWGRLDLMVNNASSFYPTSLTHPNLEEWDNLMGTNLKAPYFLSVAAIPELKKAKGNIVNLIDIYGLNPLKNHSIYCMAKAGLAMMTKSLALELAPDIRVNGVAPGAIIWPENNHLLNQQRQQKIIQKTALKRQGSAQDIAKAVRFLAIDGSYLTGQIIKVDGGRF